MILINWQKKLRRVKMTEISKIKKLLKGKTKEEKIKFCNQCLEEPNKYRPERVFALKEYLQILQ